MIRFHEQLFTLLSKLSEKNRMTLMQKNETISPFTEYVANCPAFNSLYESMLAFYQVFLHVVMIYCQY